jgi:hypothetical protein
VFQYEMELNGQMIAANTRIGGFSLDGAGAFVHWLDDAWRAGLRRVERLRPAWLGRMTGEWRGVSNFERAGADAALRPVEALAGQAQPQAPAGATGWRPEHPLAAAVQWDKVANVVKAAACSARTAEQMQSAASQQIDLAQYSLAALRQDLATVMRNPIPVPGHSVFAFPGVSAARLSTAVAA